MGSLGKLMSRFSKHTWQSAAIAILCLLFVSSIGSVTGFDNWASDLTALHAGPPSQSKDIVVVDFDDETFAKIQKYPIPRSAIAEVVRKVGDQKPRVIGMDILLSEPRDAAEDLAMQQALTSAGSVILASQGSLGGVPRVMPLRLFCDPENETAVSGFCAEGKPGALGYAFVNMPMDSDSFIRHANLFYAGPPTAASFPLILAQQYVGKPIEPVDDDRARFNGHMLYYDNPELKTFTIGSWTQDPLPTLSAWKLLDGTAPPHMLTDKLVLIGQSNAAVSDRQLTPLYREPDKSGMRLLRMSGVEILGAAIRSLLEGTVVREAPLWLRWMLIMACCWGGSYVLFRHRMVISISLVLFMAAFTGVVSTFLYWRFRYYLPFFPTALGLAVMTPLTIIAKSYTEREQLMTLFSSYVDPAVARTIWSRRGELCLAGEERMATVLFTDIRNFTALSKSKSPTEVLRWLNQYVTAMDEVIRKHDGFLNKFIGDGLMIIFGLPLSQGAQADARRAMQASLHMLEQVNLLNQQNLGDPNTPQIRIGIGMHSGPLVAGSIGSASRQEYSVIGETVNLASRLESLNKDFGTEIVLSEASYELVREEFPGFQPLGEAIIKGFEEPVAVYTIATRRTSAPPHQLQVGVSAVSPSTPHM